MLVANLLPYTITRRGIPVQGDRVRYRQPPKYRQRPDCTSDEPVVEVYARPQTSGREDETDIEVDEVEAV